MCFLNNIFQFWFHNNHKGPAGIDPTCQYRCQDVFRPSPRRSRQTCRLPPCLQLCWYTPVAESGGSILDSSLYGSRGKNICRRLVVSYTRVRHSGYQGLRHQSYYFLGVFTLCYGFDQMINLSCFKIIYFSNAKTL